MARETEVKSVVLCTLALLAGLCCALMLGCKTSAKVEGGAEIIELKPLEMQELTVPNHDYSAICEGCGFAEGTDSWCDLHTNPFSNPDNPIMISESHCIAMRQR